jgi:dUTP pyrophosphatase
MAGVIDSDYRGEIKVCLRNTTTRKNAIGMPNNDQAGTNGVFFKRGDKIAQILIQPIQSADFTEEELSSTNRGENGFGSTNDTSYIKATNDNTQKATQD